MFDLLITGGTVIDGTGRRAFRADVAVTGKTISAVGDLAGAGARRVINAAGLTVSPSFIDTHVHTDAALLNEPQHPSGVRSIRARNEGPSPTPLVHSPPPQRARRIHRWRR